MKINRRKKDIRLFILLAILLLVTIGYALLSTTLKINGSTTITKNSWSVYWDNVQVTQGSVDATTNIPEIGQDTNDPVNTKVTWSTTLSLPGDYYEFTVDAVNAGTIDAMITSIDNTVTPSLPEYIKYSVTYADGVALANNHLLAKKTGSTNTTEKYKVRVEFLDTITPAQMNEIPQAGLTYTFTFGVTYGQATDDAIARPIAGFATDSWDTIKTKVTNDKSSYNVGDTKILMLDLDGDSEDEAYFVRVANNTTPSECSTEGFSQTACGFVIEFIDIISEHRMNPYVGSTNANGNGNQGGWEYSDMRAYLNSTIYAAGSINYSTTGVYDKFPSDLKNAIIPTIVVSGYGTRDSENFTTTDNLYLLDAKELWGDEFNQSQNTAKDKERQLDYYHNEGVTMTENNSSVIKYYNGYEAVWHLRTARNDGRTAFYSVASDGGRGIGSSASATIGVAPAFRIAE